jgi:hypothetical protein
MRTMRNWFLALLPRVKQEKKNERGREGKEEGDEKRDATSSLDWRKRDRIDRERDKQLYCWK